MPHFGLPFKPRLPEHHQVEACPFSFEERERERRALKEKRLAELRNEEVGDASRDSGCAEEVTLESHWCFVFLPQTGSAVQSPAIARLRCSGPA